MYIIQYGGLIAFKHGGYAFHFPLEPQLSRQKTSSLRHHVHISRIRRKALLLMQFRNRIQKVFTILALVHIYTYLMCSHKSLQHKSRQANTRLPSLPLNINTEMANLAVIRVNGQLQYLYITEYFSTIETPYHYQPTIMKDCSMIASRLGWLSVYFSLVPYHSHEIQEKYFI